MRLKVLLVCIIKLNLKLHTRSLPVFRKLAIIFHQFALHKEISFIFFYIYYIKFPFISAPKFISFTRLLLILSIHLIYSSISLLKNLIISQAPVIKGISFH